MIKRRSFLTLLGTAAAAWPLAARAQQDGRVRRIGVLSGNATESDPNQKASLATLWEGLAKLGWAEGRNLRIDIRYAAGDVRLVRAFAAELVSLAPEVILTNQTPATIALQQQTKAIPIIFTAAGDPVASGLVRSIARPEGNTTGFTVIESSIAGKWLELLKEAAPQLTRVALLFHTELSSRVAPAYIESIEAAAPSFGVHTIKMPVRDAVDMVRAIDAFAGEPNGGLIVLPPPSSGAVLEATERLTTEHRLPTVHSTRSGVVAGGLLTYTPDLADNYRRAAGYIDRILRGAKVSELPVQFPTKFELVVNLKTAKAIGLTIPESFLLRADEVIE